ncbi:hypothetical protein ABIC66_000568 [Caulobacter sp. 1776]
MITIDFAGDALSARLAVAILEPTGAPGRR